MDNPQLHPYHGVKAHPTACISPAAGIVGDVTLGKHACILAGAQLRGDLAAIAIGDETNVQEGVLMHVDTDAPITIGRHATIGHGAILHGCQIGENVLIGMGSIIMNDARIGANCVVAAGAVVTEGKEFPEGSLIMGMPAKVTRMLSADEIDRMCTAAGDDYLHTSVRMLEEGALYHPAADLTMHIGA